MCYISSRENLLHVVGRKGEEEYNTKENIYFEESNNKKKEKREREKSPIATKAAETRSSETHRNERVGKLESGVQYQRCKQVFR